jgi:hypothetical protein
MHDLQRSLGESHRPETTDTTDAALAALRLLRGTAVFGRDGTRLGMLSRDGFQDGHLVMRRVIGGPEIALPESAMTSRDATGVYTDLTWRDLDALAPRHPGTEEGLRDAFATASEVHANKFDEDDVPS